MKITPTGQNASIIGSIEGSSGPSAGPNKIARAKAIAAGKEVPQGTSENLVNQNQNLVAQNNINKIVMKTNVSPDRGVMSPTDGANDPNPINNEEPVNKPEATGTIDPEKAALIKARRSLQVKERELAQRERLLKSQPTPTSEDLIAKLKSNPLSVLQEAGVTYDQLTEAILANQGQLDPQKLRQEIKEELKKELNEEFNVRDQQAEKQVLAQIQRDAEILTSHGEDYEAIREAKNNGHPDFSNGKDAIRDLIHRNWQKTGEVMDLEEAAKIVEEQLINEALPFGKLKKVLSRLSPPAPAVTEQIPVQKPGTRIMRTLTNRDPESSVMDRRQRALAAFNGTLKRG